MIIFLYGGNTYSRSKKLKEILSEYKNRLGAELLLERFDFENHNDFDKFTTYLYGRSMFDPKKFALIDNCFETKDKKEFKKLLEENLTDKETIIVALSNTKAPASFSFLLERPVLSQEFKDIKKGAELSSFIQKEAAARNIKLNGEEIEILSDVFGGALWGIATELDKAALTSKRVLPRAVNEDYFKLINTLKSRAGVDSKLPALEIILSDRGDEPAKVFNMLYYGFNSPELINLLADYDVKIKSGKLEYDDALLDLALK